MDKSLFRYIWRHSKRDQLVIFAVVLASLPFYFASLDLPRRIVNEVIQGRAYEGGRLTVPFLALSFEWPQWLGGGTVRIFDGFQVGRLELLFGLSTLFLFFVLVNGGFKYWINVSKGLLGERMLRRLRFDLFSLVLRFTPETLRATKASETATIIKDEVEPIGGFIGDAFVLPVFLGTQAATALLFILLQSLWLGLLAAAVVGVQVVIIPRLRRELLRLGKQRQLASRRLAGRVGEVVDGMEIVHVHNASAWERAEIGDRLYHLFDLRFRIYKRKFMVKFLNNLLAQLTPFLFYAIGGYFALKGDLNIGQLVAVIAAYRELPPPLKELIDWDQQRLDVQVKYDQVVQHFSPERLLPVADEKEPVAGDTPLLGDLEVRDLHVVDAHGAPLIENASFVCPAPARIAVIADGGQAASTFARVVAHRHAPQSGSVLVGGHDIAGLHPAVIGRHMAYAGVEPILFPGTLRDNLVYGLRHRPLAKAAENQREAARRLAEALRTGNPVDRIQDQWIDYALGGVSDADELDQALVRLLKRVGLDEELYRFGLSGSIDPTRHPDLAGRIIEARTRLRQRLEAGGMADLVEPFDSERYNTHATVAENLLFGVPVSRELIGRNLAEHAGFRDVLDREGLTDDLVAMGMRIAETMTEIFRGLPPGHPLFEQFSFIAADELPDYEDMLRRRGIRGRGGLTGADQTRLLTLPLGYIEARHRLGLLDDRFRARLVAARRRIREMLESTGDPGVEFYDAARVCAAAPFKDNLLFGRVNHSIANAQARVTDAITEIIDDMGLRSDVERVALDHQVGPAGRLLTAPQRAAVSLVRCLVKRPDVLVVDGALAPLGEARARSVLDLLLELFRDKILIVVLPNERETDGFDAIVRFRDARAVLEARGARARPESARAFPVAAAIDQVQEKVAAGGAS